MISQRNIAFKRRDFPVPRRLLTNADLVFRVGANCIRPIRLLP